MTCLDENALQALARGWLGAEALGRAHEHLDVCALCCRLAAEVAEDASIHSQAGTVEPWATADSGPSEPGSPAAGGYPLGRYFVIGSLGQGGMGQVLLAYDAKLDRKVALKQVRARESPLPPEARALLLREAQAMARLSHPNVLTVHDAGEIDGQVIIAMEYVQGRTLRHWLKEPRSWREILATLCASGEGLAAAHRAGLTHRDFKPDNVLVGEDGRVRVTDFGLARAERSPELVLEGLAPEGSRNLAAPRTDSGALSGTPGYVAPEALRGEQGPLSDQFSFFVSLYEALYGERPFEGSSLGGQLRAAEQGRVRPAPRGRSVPKWLRRLVLIGLSPEPGKRFSSMADALAALGRASQRSSRLGRVAMAPAGLAAIGAAVLWTTAWPARLCAGAERHLAGTWDEEGKQKLRSSFLSTQAPAAEATFRETARALDAWASNWVRMRTQACVATRVVGEQSPQVMDLKLACLDRRWMDFEALVRRLSTTGEVPLDHAVKAASILPEPFECANPSALGGQALPTDGVTRTSHDRLRRQMAEARAALLVRTVEPGIRLARQVESEARALHLEALRTEALIIIGRLRDASGAYPAAEESLLEGAALALAQGLDALVAEANIELMMVIGSRMRRFGEARRWEKLAWASIARSGLSGQDPEARLLNVAGNVAAWEQSHDRALELYKRALTLRERLHGPEHILVADVLHNLAAESAYANLPEDALVHARRALAIRERLLGPEHQDTAASVDLLGIVVRRFGQVDQALALAERAVSLGERTHPPDHPFEAVFLVNLGLARGDVGDFRGAEEATERALAIQRESLGEDHPAVGATLENLAWLAILRADYRRAIELGEEVVRRFPAKAAEALGDLGEAYRRAGKTDEARQHFERALKTFSARPDERVQVSVMTGLAECELARGQRARALGRLEQALDMGERIRLAPHRLALTRFALARALPSTEADRARSLAREARAWFEKTVRAAELGKADRFLESLPP
jgi:tetratricopeptide (TPR) repeat protein/predicted Ser/Thr protein kinase